VQAVKKELTGWDTNNAVSVVEMKDVPKNAKLLLATRKCGDGMLYVATYNVRSSTMCTRSCQATTHVHPWSMKK
jgi:hypothetical protein